MGKHKHTIDVGNPEIFKHYCKVTGNPHNLTQGKYFEIFDMYIDYVKHLMVYNSFKFTMPYRLGTVAIYGYKVKIKLMPDGSLDKRNLRIDWNATKKYWAEIYPNKTPQELKLIKNKPKLYHTNKHSDGKRYRIQWIRTTATFRFKMHYNVKPLRQFVRFIAHAIIHDKRLDFNQFDPGIIDYTLIRKSTQEKMKERERELCGMESM